MAWIESHQELREHPKTKRLCRLLALPRPMVVGYLHFLWWWAYDYAPEGDLSAFTDEDIADAVDWDGDPSAFVQALVQAGFVDEGRLIHDWGEFAQKWIERRRADRERKRSAAQKTANSKRDPEVQTTSDGDPPEIHSRSGVTGPDLTVPDRTGPPPPTPSPHSGRGNGAAAPAGKRARSADVATNGVMPSPPSHPPPKLPPCEEWIEPGHPDYSPLVGRYKRVRV